MADNKNTCPICNKPTFLVYGKYPRKDGLCADCSHLLFRNEIEICKKCNQWKKTKEPCSCFSPEKDFDNLKSYVKKDDISIVDKIDCLHKDSQEKNLIDYIVEYESLKIFSKLCSSNPDNITKFKLNDAIRLSILSNNLNFLRNTKCFKLSDNIDFWFKTEHDIKELMHEEALEHYKGFKDEPLCILNDELFSTIISDNRINNSTLSWIFEKKQNQECIWYYGYPYLIHYAYKYKKDSILNKLIKTAEENNRNAYENRKGCSINYFSIGSLNGKNGHGLVRILKRTLELALSRKDMESLNTFNKINSDIMNFCTDFKCSTLHSDIIATYNNSENEKCIICGQPSNGKPQCRSCFDESLEFMESLDRNNNIRKTRDHYYNLRERIYIIKSQEQAQKQCRRLIGIAMFADRFNSDSSLVQRVYNDVKPYIDKFKEIEINDKYEEEKKEKDETKSRVNTAQDGHNVDSDMEVRIDDVLYNSYIIHAYGISIPEITEKRKKCDWFIPISNGKGIYVEYWGMNTPKYKAERKEKEELYQKHNIPYISIEADDPKQDTLTFKANLLRELRIKAEEFYGFMPEWKR